MLNAFTRKITVNYSSYFNNSNLQQLHIMFIKQINVESLLSFVADYKTMRLSSSYDLSVSVILSS